MVVKNQRTLSPLEFFVQAMKIREELTLLMLHDFGAKKKVKSNSEIILKNISHDDRKTILEILEKENSHPVTVERFPSWFMDLERHFFTTILRHLINSIVYANTIYPTSLPELDERRKHQTAAIADCECILQELYFVQRVLQVDINYDMPVVREIEREIMLLKSWRKSDHRIRKMIKRAMKEDPSIDAVKLFAQAFASFISSRDAEELMKIDLSDAAFQYMDQEYENNSGMKQ